ncbi:MAG: oligosaccharide flippase family protein, partial [Saprospiraceae bacterium]|nr:oligosaccharide flippase family protein [Saprospiraceae bacterium]
SKVLTFIIHLVTGYYFNRLIEPEFHGNVGLAMSFTSLVNLIWSLELSSLLIRVKAKDNRVLSTAFWAAFGMSSFLSILFIALSGVFTELVDGSPDVRKYIILFSLTFFIFPLGLVPTVKLKQSLKFDLIGIVNFFAKILGILGALVLAILGEKFWSLFVLFGSYAVLMPVFKFIARPWLPSFQFDGAFLKQHAIFNGSLMFNKISGWLTENLDKQLVGKFWGEAALGGYNKAIGFLLMPKTYLVVSISDVLFPALSAENIDEQEKQKRFLDASALVTFLLFPLFFVLAALAQPFTYFYFPEEWDRPTIQWLIVVFSAAGLFSIFNPMFFTVLMSKSKPKFLFNVLLVKRIVLIAGILATFKFGLIALAFGKLGSEIIAFLINLFIGKKELAISRSQFVRSMLAGLLCSLIAAIAAYTLSYFLNGHTSYLINFLACGCLSVVVYFGISPWLNPSGWRFFRNFIANWNE